METSRYWEEIGNSVKYENYPEEYSRPAPSHGDLLNFSAIQSEDETEYPQSGFLKKGKVTRQDPMSHRIIEKRRRDRMNNCLADLSRLIPPEYLKKGRGRIEKTEIIEMAIRHLKYLGERAKASERQVPEVADQFRSGYQEAAAEAIRFLVEVRGYNPGDGLCVHMSTHMQRHCEILCKADTPRDKPRYSYTNGNGGSSSETASTNSSMNGNGYAAKPVVITRTEPPSHQEDRVSAECIRYVEPYDVPDPSFTMDCDRGSGPILATTGHSASQNHEPLPLDARRKREATLRAIRKPEQNDDYLHLYKFKNSIERRFSRSQDNEASEFTVPAHAHDMSVQPTHAHRPYSHKRRRAVKPLSTSTSNSGSTEDNTSPQDTSSDSPHTHRHVYEKPAVSHMSQYVPVFALNAFGKYYVPLNIEYACLAKYLGPYDILDARPAQMTAPLHPVTIHVNFQPFLSYVKRETDRDRRAT